MIVFWVESEEDKQALVLDESTPFFTHAALRRPPVGAAARLPDRRALAATSSTEVVQDAWLARAGKRARAAWLAEHPSAQ